MKFLIVLFFSITAFTANAQQFTAGLAFDQAATQYIAGNNQAAMQAVDQGLRFYPNDEKLQQLKNKLEEQKKHQQQQQQNQQNKNQQQQQNQQQDSQQQEGQGQEKKEEGQQPKPGKDAEPEDGKPKSEEKEGEKKEGEEKQKDQQGKGEGEKKSEEDTEETSLGEADQNQDGEEREPLDPSELTEQRLKEMNISPEKAKMILEAMRSNEIQYLQQQRRRSRGRNSDKPDW